MPEADGVGAAAEPGDDNGGSAGTGSGEVEMVGLASGVGELVEARPNRDANGLESRVPLPLPEVPGSVCLALGRGGRGGPFTCTAGRGGRGRLLVCVCTLNEGYGDTLRECWRWWPCPSAEGGGEADRGLGRGAREVNADTRVDGVRRAWNGLDDGDNVERKASILLLQVTRMAILNCQDDT